MKLSHILYTIYFCIIANSFLLFIFGEKGLFAYHQLMEYEDTLKHNIENLEEKNHNLENQLQWVSENPEAIKLMARELGLYEQDEQVIRIKNLPVPENYYELGKIFKFNKIYLIKNSSLQLISFILSIFVFIMFIITDKRIMHGNKTKLTGFYSKDTGSFKKA